MTYRELMRKLRVLGCEFKRASKGSHEIWINPHLSTWVHFRMEATFLKLHRRARSVRRVARNFSAFSANSAVKSNAYLAFAPELKCTLSTFV
ncbi:MAG: type II toxin-antitoxin system HicA family toxin [Anaerolineae bacterium]